MSVGDKNNRCYLISYVSDQDTAGFEPDTQQEIRKKALSYGVDALLSVKGRK